MILVSNRLPFTVKQEGHRFTFDASVGGLATGLRTYVESMDASQAQISEYLWVGWPGATIDEVHQSALQSQMLKESNAYPVFLDERDVENFYQGFCNKTIWPLFHYFPAYAKFDQEFWSQYEKVNRAFCETLARIVQPGDLLWIHDYHLMLLPNLLRQRLPNNPIGFFLHIPFPTFEVYRLLPRKWRTAILQGLLGADLIGFHTYDYMQDFLRCVLRILGYEHTMGQLLLKDRAVTVAPFPMGIDFKKFMEASGSPQLEAEKIELRKPLGDSKAILSIDRLDYSKGILNRLEGYETFLESNPDWHGRVTLLAVVVPSRIGVHDYDLMKKQIEELIGKINGRFGRVGWTPISYQYRALSFQPLVSMYGVSHVALITPLRDGMNLIAKEYVASRSDQTGVLILSEMAGSAKELSEAIIINPNNREEIADSLKEALEMPVEEQIRRNTVMQNRLRRYDVVRWAGDFMNTLSSTPETHRAFTSKLLTETTRDQLIERFYASSRRLLFLDYDGTLVPFVRRPSMAKPTEELLQTLRALAMDPKNDIVLISGRNRRELEGWFAGLPLSIIAEHGIWIKESNGEWRMFKAVSNEWKPKILPILERYADRVPGSMVEEKEYSLVWHYRAADPELGKASARELTDDLMQFTANIDVQVLQGHKIVEVRNAGITKGVAALYWIDRRSADFVLALGDDATDEDLFAALPSQAETIRVGLGRTGARYTIRDPKKVHELLVLLAGIETAVKGHASIW